jgi:hypothetical protein
MVIIKATIIKVIPMDNKLATISVRGEKETKSFTKISFFHVQRCLNSITDQSTNIPMELDLNVLMKRGVATYVIFPNVILDQRLFPSILIIT